MTITTGFPPILGRHAQVLILGTLPSQKSLETGQYYGHPRNAFWSIMGELFGAGPELPYTQRTDALIASGIAVWDVLEAAIRPGSLDSNIDEKTARANDFVTLIDENPRIHAIFFNGQAAAKLFHRLVSIDILQTKKDLQFFTMPSTSPAHASMDRVEKTDAWSAIPKVISNT